jgi:iron(III) transport system permease protein
LGTAIGIAYIRAFNHPLPGIGIPLTSIWIILPIVLAVRRPPYTVRGSFSSLLLVHESLEEGAGSVGATTLRTFWDVTLPSPFSFVTSFQEASPLCSSPWVGGR